MTSSLGADADNLYNLTRAFARRVAPGAVLGGPTVYAVLGDMKNSVGYDAAFTLDGLAAALMASLDVMDVREDDGADPRERAAEAAVALQEAATLAARIGQLLDTAQSAVARQSAEPRS